MPPSHLASLQARAERGSWSRGAEEPACEASAGSSVSLPSGLPAAVGIPRAVSPGCPGGGEHAAECPRARPAAVLSGSVSGHRESAVGPGRRDLEKRVPAVQGPPSYPGRGCGGSGFPRLSRLSRPVTHTSLWTLRMLRLSLGLKLGVVIFLCETTVLGPSQSSLMSHLGLRCLGGSPGSSSALPSAPVQRHLSSPSSSVHRLLKAGILGERRENEVSPSSVWVSGGHGGARGGDRFFPNTRA